MLTLTPPQTLALSPTSPLKLLLVGGYGRSGGGGKDGKRLRAGLLDKLELNQPTRGLLLHCKNLIIFLNNQNSDKLSEIIVWGKRH